MVAKWMKRIGIGVISLPVLLIVGFILFEIFGMCVNHAATAWQTRKMAVYLADEIPDIEVGGIYGQTGNTSGTGNHVDCLSVATFTTSMKEEEIREALSEHYTFDEWYCFIQKEEDGSYTFCQITSAPFADNIEGH